MGSPVLIGAGIGAATSLAMGRDPLMGAALGGISGGAFGGAEGFGSGFAEGGLFTDGLFDVGLSAAEPAAQFGTVQGAEYIPTHMVDSAYGAPIGNANMAGYQGSLGMFDQPQFLPQDAMYNYQAGTFNTPYPKFDAITDTMPTGGGYDPRLGNQAMNQFYPTSPNFNAIPMGNTTMSGGGAEAGGSFADQMSRFAQDTIKDIDTSDAAMAAVSAYDKLSPQQKQVVAERIEGTLPSDPQLVANSRMGNLLDVKTEYDKYKRPRGLFYPQSTFV